MNKVKKCSLVILALLVLLIISSDTINAKNIVELENETDTALTHNDTPTARAGG